MPGTLILLSGGQDSTTAAMWAKRNLPGPHAALSFFYGQRHKAELDCAVLVAAELGLAWRQIDVEGLFTQLNPESALLKDNLDISAASTYDPALPASFVPGRNMIFLAIASIEAALMDVNHIVAGMCQEDYSGYPDCRADFLELMSDAAAHGLNKLNLEFHFPVLYKTKAQTWQMAEELGGLELVRLYSHTCYNGDRSTLNDWGYGCGHCPACKVREKGWRESGLTVPAQEA